MNPLHHPDHERCKNLTEIGFSGTQLYMYEFIDGGKRIESYAPDGANKRFVYPSVMELLDVIPNHESFKISRSIDDEYIVDYMRPCFYDDCLPNALCDLVFWLYNNKYITFPTHE